MQTPIIPRSLSGPAGFRPPPPPPAIPPPNRTESISPPSPTAQSVGGLQVLYTQLRAEMRAAVNRLEDQMREKDMENAALRGRVLQLEGRLHDHTDALSAIQAEAEGLRRDLDGAMQTIEFMHEHPTAGPAQSAGTASQAREPKLPDIGSYDGSGSFATWLATAKGFFAAQPTTYSSALTRAHYLGQRLSGRAAAHYMLWSRSIADNPTTAEADLVARLEAAFDDPNRARNAQRELSLMRQGANETARNYSLRFTEKLAEADYPSEEPLATTYIDSFRPDIRVELQRYVNMKVLDAKSIQDISQWAIRISDDLTHTDRLRKLQTSQGAHVRPLGDTFTSSGTPRSKPASSQSPDAPCHLNGHYGHTNAKC